MHAANMPEVIYVFCLDDCVRQHLVELLTVTFFSFPERFNDIHVPIRLECVKFASHCLMNHPDLAKDLTGKSAEMG